MPIWHDQFRGYRISYPGNHQANILAPNGEAVLPDLIEAEPKEGRVKLRSRAHMSTPTLPLLLRRESQG